MDQSRWSSVRDRGIETINQAACLNDRFLYRMEVVVFSSFTRQNDFLEVRCKERRRVLAMLVKFISALISSLLCCTILAMMQYTPVSERQSDTYYFSFSSLLFIYLIYATPVYVLGGIPFSILIERITGKLLHYSRILPFLINLILYASSGMLLMWLIFQEQESLFLFGAGAASALLYYFVLLLFRYLLRSWRSP